MTHTDTLPWSTSTCLMSPDEYRSFTRSNRYTYMVDYCVFNHEKALGLWTVKFNRNVSLTVFTMMLNIK